MRKDTALRFKGEGGGGVPAWNYNYSFNGKYRAVCLAEGWEGHVVDVCWGTGQFDEI